jgi:SurA N-terminal domain
MPRRFPIIFLVALVATVAACGGSSSSSSGLKSGDVAVVEGIHITQTELDHQIAILTKSMKLQKQTVPASGSSQYKTTVIQPALHRLVQNAEVQLVATQLKVTQTPAETQTALNAAIKQYYGGSKTKYQADLTKYGLTNADVLSQFQIQGLEQKITAKLQAEVHVTPQQVQDYYNQNKAQYTTTADQRKVDYILVPSKSVAASDLK